MLFLFRGKAIYIADYVFFTHDITTPFQKSRTQSILLRAAFALNSWSKEMNLFFRDTNSVLVGYTSHLGYEIPVFFGRLRPLDIVFPADFKEGRHRNAGDGLLTIKFGFSVTQIFLRKISSEQPQIYAQGHVLCGRSAARSLLFHRGELG